MGYGGPAIKGKEVHVSHIGVIICRVDEPEQMTELAAFDLGDKESVRLEAAHMLDDLRAQTHWVGNAILCRLLQTQRDSREPIKVASWFGLVQLARQICTQPDSQRHTIPGNAVLPAHQGMLITRGLQEWACLLSQDVSFSTAARLLSWQTQEAQVLSDTTLRKLVRDHGQIIRMAEQVEMMALAQQPDLLGSLQEVPRHPSRQRRAWPIELNAAVEAALVAKQVRPPGRVSWADWARVRAVRQAEAQGTAAQLRHLGPELAANDVSLTVDEVLACQASPHHFWELRTARLATAEGYRYLTGSGAVFLQELLTVVRLALRPERSLLLLADGARWIRTFFTDAPVDMPHKQMILDWYHLHHQCRVYCRRIVSDPVAQAPLLRRVSRRLWQGKVESTLRLLDRCHAPTHDTETLDRFISYRLARQSWIPNCRQRRIDRQYIGSGHAEKANDLVVAKCQKRGGMQWSQRTSEALANRRTLFLNNRWDRYWAHGEVLPLAA